MRALASFIGGIVLFVSVSTLDAQPRYETYSTYYDESGNQVGYLYIGCFGNQWGGTSTDSYTVEYTAPCDLEQQPISCAAEGLTTIGSCPNPYWCVSQGYAMSYGNDMVSNCEGICLYGEGPGAGGSMYCSTCWKGTGSCPAKSRFRRYRTPSLIAAMRIKMWEPLAVLIASR